ncbi:MAG: bacteriocin [Blautia sp.]|nr:bacteriocin [Blautia sp.]
MADKKMQELSLDELAHVTGGLIVETEKKYYLVDDKTGAVKASNTSLNAVQMGASLEKQSGKVISEREYKKRFGKALD